MRSVGVLVLFLGLVALLAPSLRYSVPYLDDISTDTNFTVVGGCLCVLGLTALWFGRRNEEDG